MKPSLPPGTTSAAPKGASKKPMTPDEFAGTLREQLRLEGRVADIRVVPSLDRRHGDSVYVNFINLPEEVARRREGGGAENENNRASFWVRGFGLAPSPEASTVKVEQSNSSLYRGAGAPSRETRVSMRAKTGAPEGVAKHLADFLNKVVLEVPPRFTHTQR